MTAAKTVLIIDDDESHLLTARAAIEALGYRVEIHNSPFLSTAKVLQTRPDLLLLDVNMPALAGDQLCELLRKTGKLADLPIYLYSSNDEDTLRQAVLQSGANGYICKGDVGGLRQKVKSLLA